MLKIVPIESSSEHHHPAVKHPILPQHEFSMLIVAPKGSGKTNFICNLLLNHYKEYFHKILICSPTIDNDEKWDIVKNTKHVLKENKKLLKIQEQHLKKGDERKGELPIVVHQSKAMSFKDQQCQKQKQKFKGKIPEENFFDNLQEVPHRIKEQQDIIEMLRELGYEQRSKYIADRMLVVLDDQAGMFKGGNTNNPLVNYVIKHRHSSSSLIIVTQAYKAIPKTVRTNCNALILFDIPSLAELKVIWEEYPENNDWEEWFKLYQYATHKNFDFMYINNKFPKGHRIHRNFEEELFIESKKSSDSLRNLDEAEDLSSTSKKP